MSMDPWFLSEGTIDELPALIRGREMLPVDVTPASHPNLLSIIWDYEGDLETRMPSEADSREMEEFEELIVPALEQNNVCALFVVITHDGQRCWQFYCRDKETTQAAIWSALGTEGNLPIDLQMDDDPEWAALSEIMEDTDRAH
jgi:hypothetical protein